jgi:CheY-like chemotaxis protein
VKSCGVLPRRPLVVAVTGYADKREECAAAGFDHYFVKPADPFAIETIINDYVRQLQSPGLDGAPPPPA